MPFSDLKQRDRFVSSLSLCHILEKQSTVSPTSIAIQGVDYQYTYGDFVNATRHLAHELAAEGAGIETKVGICLHRSFEMVLGIFGILRAGAGYVPVDPSFPDSRIASVFADAGVGLVITTPEHVERLRSLGFRPMVADVNTSPVAQPNELPEVSSDFTAYVLFTSGSTGTPKGVEISHGSVVNLVRYIQDRYPIGVGDRVMLKSPYTFDGSVWELFGWMEMGGTLFIAPFGAEKDPGTLIHLIDKYQIGFMFFVPSMLQAFLDYAVVRGAVRQLGSMKWISVGGEVLPVPLVRLFYQVFDGQPTRLFNVYGPTETTVYATTYLCQPGVDYEKMPIGEAVTNDCIYILGEDLKPVARGAEGEIFIGGAGVGKGYLNRPDLNAERFLPDPFMGSGLMYRTGDIGRQIGDDLYDFIGRRDFQVKLRGLRIEMGEVEHALQSLDVVHECVVLFAKDRNGDDCLVAYIRPGAPLGVDFTTPYQMASEAAKESLVALLSGLLPSYMIPSEMVFCAEFPLSSHGKIDRKQLPAVTDLVVSGLQQDEFVPADEVEQKVYAIWKEVLGRTSVGVSEDFFAAGGHSLKALQVITAVIREFGVELPLKSFYNHLTLVRLSLEIKTLADDPARELLTNVAHDPERCEYPLSSAMQELWFVNSLDFSGISRNIQLEFTIRGKPDRDRFIRALKQVVDEEPMFRSVFPLSGEVPVQRILSEALFDLSEDDVSGLAGEARTLRYRAIAASHGRRRFNPEQLPLLAFKWVRWSAGEFRLLMNIHHLIFDGWSLELFVKRLIGAYEGVVAAPREQFSAGDFAIWQQQNVNLKVYNEEIEFWKRQLASIPEALTLPLRPEVDRRALGNDGDRYWWALPAPLTRALDEVALRLKVTPFAVLTAGFQLALAAHSSQRDIVVGTPYANRNHPMSENLIGLFTNMVSIRLTIDDSDTVATLIHRCSIAASEAFSHASVIFSEVVKVLVPRLHRGINPLFQASMVMQNWPGTTAVTGDFSIFQHEIGNNTSKLDLMMNVEKDSGEYVCWLEYNTALFDKAFITTLASGISLVYDYFTAGGDTSAKDIMQALNPTSLTRLKRVNPLHVDHSSHRCIHHLVERQAILTPKKVAVVSNGNSISYAELNKQADVLACFLVAQGVQAGQAVAVFLNRGIELVTSLLAVLKTGAAYVPIDPVFPPSRLALIFAESNPALILTEKALLTDLPVTHFRLGLIDQSDDHAVEEHPCLAEVEATATAYIIFTSGSTGKPKGVVIPHRAVTNFLISMQRQPGISADDILLAVTTISFDIAGLEIWLPLITGATVVMADAASVTDPVLLAETISGQGVTIVQATPVTFQMLTDIGWKGDSRLKMLCGGEALSTSLASALLPRCRELWNMYGPTETTIWSTIHKVTPDDTRAAGYVSIGKPIMNTTVYVLNECRLPVPDGYSGELYIGGAGLADGYYQQAALTADRFLPDPFCLEAGARMYRTGDRVRFGPDDRLEYVERIDSQIKIRGFRVEPGEIESVLSTHASVDAAVVVAHDFSETHKVLVAFIKCSELLWPGETVYRDLLRGKVPDYMVPSFYIRMESFPLTPNGKVDKNALNAGQYINTAARSEESATLNPTEKVLLDVWKQVLNIGTIRLDDDFFDVGGNSLVAVRLMINIEKALGKRLPLAVLFQHGTIRAMARLISAENEGAKHRSLVAIKRDGSRIPLFLIHAAGLNLLLYNTIVKHLHADQPVYGLQAKGLDGADEPLDKLEEIAAYYIEEVLSVEPDGPYALAGFCMGGTIAYEMARQLELAGKKVCFVGLFETVAHRIPEVRPSWLSQKLEDGWFLFRKIGWNLIKFLKIPVYQKFDYFMLKWRWIYRRMTGVTLATGSRLEHEEVEGVIQVVNAKVKLANEAALSRYVLRPWNGVVHLFKAKQQTFYIAEPSFYGWQSLALNGVKVIDVDGTHSKIFAPPNDHSFASTLQALLDECCSRPSTRKPDDVGAAIVIASGRPSGCEGDLSVAFVGDNPKLREWWFDQFFPDGFRVDHDGSKVLQADGGSLDAQLQGVQMVLADASADWGKGKVSAASWFVPQWVELELPLADVDFEKHCSKFRKTRNAIRQAAYEAVWFEGGEAPLSEFYARMYVPYISHRQGKHVILSSIDEFSQILADGGQLLMIGRNSQFVAGAIIDNQVVPLVHSIGVSISGDFDHLGHEIIRSLFYFSAIKLKSQGYSRLNLGGCRPLVNDNSLWFKKSLGGEVVPCRVFKGLGTRLWFRHDSVPLRHWLASHPFFVADENDLPGPIAFLSRVDRANPSLYAPLLHKLMIQRVRRPVVFVFDAPEIEHVEEPEHVDNEYIEVERLEKATTGVDEKPYNSLFAPESQK